METHGILQMENTHNVVNVFLVDGITAVPAFQHELDGLSQQHLMVNRQNIISVGHDILCFFVPELENIGDHLRLTGLDHTLFMALIDHADDLLLCYIHIVRPATCTEKPQQSIGGHCHQSGERKQHLGQIIHRRDTGICPFLRYPGTQLLGKQHTQGQGYVQNQYGRKH